MKSIVSVSLGPRSLDASFKARFLGQEFKVRRIGTDNDLKAAQSLVAEWRDRVDALGLGMVRDHYWVGTNHFVQRDTAKLEQMAGDTLVSLSLIHI